MKRGMFIAIGNEPGREITKTPVVGCAAIEKPILHILCRR